MQQPPTNGTASGAVYVQTNAAPNEVIAFSRAADGSLDRMSSVETAGDGDGSPHLTSQGSVVLTGDGRHLLVTNAATDDLSVFSVATNARSSCEIACTRALLRRASQSTKGSWSCSTPGSRAVVVQIGR
jgi:hypothetical protein